VSSSIARVYVVDAGVAFYGGGEAELFPPTERALSVASSWFLTRAAHHGAQLHVPSVFYSEVSSLVAQDLISLGTIDLADGTNLLEAMLGTNWEMHIAVFADVLRIHQDLEPTGRTNDAEYLALSEMLKCTLITTDEGLRAKVLERSLGISMLLIDEHPWSQPGSPDDFPPTD
jgi:predicted nucleic acid-binding protein